MILAIGMNALLQVKKIKNIPVVYIMVLNPHAILSGKQNMTGIRMNVSPARQTALLLKVLPDVKSIGLLYDPSQTAYLVKEVRDAAAKAGVELIAEEVRRSREVPSRIIDMKGRIDLFWMLPDTTVVTPETVEFLFLFFLDNRIPVFSFSKKYVESGALMSIDIDVFDMGRQAGELVKAIQAGKGIDHNAHSVEANKVRLSINPEIARNLGIHIDQDIIEQAHIVGKGK
jgi:putative ABC transport system substrate-binding protein